MIGKKLPSLRSYKSSESLELHEAVVETEM